MSNNFESSLPRVTTLADSDDIRVISGSTSSNISFASFEALLTASSSTGVVRTFRTVALSTALALTDDVLMVLAGADLTITLPDVTTATSGTVYTIKKVDISDVFTVTLATSLSQTIDGNDTFILEGPKQVFVNVMAADTEWFVI